MVDMVEFSVLGPVLDVVTLVLEGALRLVEAAERVEEPKSEIPDVPVLVPVLGVVVLALEGELEPEKIAELAIELDGEELDVAELGPVLLAEEIVEIATELEAKVLGVTTLDFCVLGIPALDPVLGPMLTLVLEDPEGNPMLRPEETVE